MKEELGEDYNFKNFKITGPDFTKISIGIKGFKNKKKTDYIRSKHLITFYIESNSKEKINYTSNLIKLEFPQIMNYINRIHFFNFLDTVFNRINFMCNEFSKLKINFPQQLKIKDKNLHNLICEEKKNILSKIKKTSDGLNLVNIKKKKFSIKDREKIKHLKVNISKLEQFISYQENFKIIFPLYFTETLNYFLLLENLNPQLLFDNYTPKFLQISKNNPEKKIIEKNNINRAIIYLNFLIMLFFFASSYLSLIVKKKNENNI